MNVQVPVDIIFHKQSKTLEFVYEDARHVLPFEFLRVLSPSAEVQGHSPDQAVLQVGKRDVEIESIQPVGTYALRLCFSDGHDSGYYSWEYLYELGEHQEQLWKDYLLALEKHGASRDPEDPRNSAFLPKPKTSCKR